MANSFIRNYFGFNKQQRNGLLTLVLISSSLLLVRIIFPYFIDADKIQIKNLPLFERKLDSSFNSSITTKNSALKLDSLTLFNFDPNFISQKELIKLGFTSKIATIFLNYRDKGFVFKNKKDLLKIYGISDQFYSKLEPYIIIQVSNSNLPNKYSNKLNYEKVVNVKKQVKIELNSTDSLTLISINGIGSYFAKGILKYKIMLGGYVRIEQLKEVYGMKEEIYERVKSNFTINLDLVKKININKDDFKTVNKHPYISYELTKIIFDWRRKTIINKTNLIDIIKDENIYQKVIPYLVFE